LCLQVGKGFAWGPSRPNPVFGAREWCFIKPLKALPLQAVTGIVPVMVKPGSTFEEPRRGRETLLQVDGEPE
jgi:hypothetical protein